MAQERQKNCQIFLVSETSVVVISVVSVAMTYSSLLVVFKRVVVGAGTRGGERSVVGVLDAHEHHGEDDAEDGHGDDGQAEVGSEHEAQEEEGVMPLLSIIESSSARP